MLMRSAFLLLVFANLAFFAYAQFAGESAARRQVRAARSEPREDQGAQGVRQERARPVPGRDRQERARRRTATAVPAACLEWGIFAGPVVARADAALARLELPQDRVERTVTDAGGYWVYVPPLKTKSETDRKIGELKALGVNDFFVVQDAGQWRNAISLGIFRTDEAAQGYLARLKERGVRSAVAERRENFLKQIAFLVREPDEATGGAAGDAAAGVSGERAEGDAVSGGFGDERLSQSLDLMLGESHERHAVRCRRCPTARSSTCAIRTATSSALSSRPFQVLPRMRAMTSVVER